MADMTGKGVIFDLDGVLVDTSEYHFQAWRQWAEREVVTISREQFRRTFGMQNYQIIPLLLSREVSREEIDEMSDWKEARYRDFAEGKVELISGVERLIKKLKEHGFLLAIGTSTPLVNLNLMLENTIAGDYIDEYVTGEEVKNGKPAPDTFVEAAKKLGLSASRCVVVEDAVAGVEAGKAGGMKVVAVTTTRQREELGAADMVVDSMEELSARDFEKLLEGV
ncbi:MAG: HAD family hydrolase [Planctomycetota bacterium]|jgi:beta-phosphoglucomutase family hydrolase